MTDTIKFGGIIFVSLIFSIFFFTKEGSEDVILDIKNNIESQKIGVDKNFKTEDDPILREDLRKGIISDPQISEMIAEVSGEFERLKKISQ